MYDYIGLVTNDLDASIGFYQVLANLGYAPCCRDVSGADFDLKNAPTFWLSTGEGGSGAHIAFYQAGLEARGQDNVAPALRPDYSLAYDAAFLLDPDGNNNEVVCMRQGN